MRRSDGLCLASSGIHRRMENDARSSRDILGVATLIRCLGCPNFPSPRSLNVRMVSRWARWLASWFPFRRRWKSVIIDDTPGNLSSRTVYLVREDDTVWQAVMLCPCGCGVTIQLCCLPDIRPRWSYRQESNGTITLHPSVWRKVGCRSHFFLRNGRIIWC